jgi:2-(1,2-epoxy-1,2-dihydrophenyl)acetyl-CoA isomerase
MPEEIELTIDHSVATLTLNRPEKLNAITFSMWDELVLSLQDLSFRQDVNCVVLAGSGSHFCAGTDITDMGRHAQLPPSKRAAFFAERLERTNRTFGLLQAMPQPVVSSVRGVAAGGGFGLAVGADLVVASESARFSAATPSFGAIPDCGVPIQLLWAVGLKKAKQYCLMGEELSAAVAADVGLVNWVVGDDDLEQKTMQVAQHLASMPRQPLALAKAAFGEMSTRSLAEHLAQEARDVGACVTDADFPHRVERFLGSSRPRLDPTS